MKAVVNRLSGWRDLPFERGKIVSVDIRGTRLTTDNEIRKMLGIETGRVYTREQIEKAVDDVSSNHRLVNSTSYSVNEEGELSVRVYEIDPFEWDTEPYFTFSRVAGLGTGLQATLKSQIGPLSEIGGGGQYHWHNEEWTFRAHANRQFFNRNRFEIGGTFRQAYESNMEWAIPRYDAYLNAFVLGLEPENYFYVEGGTGYVKQRIGSWLTRKRLLISRMITLRRRSIPIGHSLITGTRKRTIRSFLKSIPHV